VPEDAPNHYLYNVQKDDVDSLQALLSTLQTDALDWYPMVLGRVTHINGVSAEILFPDDKDEPEIFERELNLTWANDLGADNKIVAGEFSIASEGISIEAEAAKEVGVSVGDELSIYIGGNEYSLPITSIRSVDWSSMRPNFYLMLPRSVLEDFPANYITSVFIEPQNHQSFYRSMADYPTVSLLNVGELTAQIQSIISQVSEAIQLVLIFIVAAGALVLIASVRATLDERLEEGALLRTLGASKKLIQSSMLVEFGFLGVVAGSIAAIAAELCLFGLQVFVFKLAASWHPILWLLGPVSGFVLVTLIGLVAGRSVLKVPPMRMLRAL